ncbi:MAG: terminase, partial [Acidobacteriales bacterium]|nr:terminase [Terriglobales bacterium]
GAVDIESTPNGAGGYFHAQWLRAVAGGGYTPHFFPWWLEPAYRLPLAPGESLEPFSEEETLLMAKEKLAPEQIKYRRYLARTFGGLAPQEFAETDTDCFLVSGRPVFDVHAIDARLRQLPSPLRISQNAAECIWLEPQQGRSYVIGADVAEGGAEGDFSAAVVLDLDTGLQCAELMARWPLSRFAQELARLGERYNGALIAVERNNHGHAVLYALQHEFNYSRLYQHAESAGGTAKLGWPMNARTKPQAIGALGQMLRDPACGTAFASRRLLEQCRSFAYGDDCAMAALPGTHDDLVIAAAIALAVREQGGGLRLAGVPR